jgi:uncharacterized protein YegP (UPF0339 family)
MGKFEIRKTATGVKFDLRAGNGETVATSEVYETEAACRKGIESVRKNAEKAKMQDMTQDESKTVTNPKFELFQDKQGNFRFRLRARNGGVIAVSEGYSTKAACCGGIESVRRNGPDAPIESE